MNDPSTSLDRLHDVVSPAEIRWWPPAPGWYGVAGFVLLLLGIFGFRAWKRWRANAYRRAALRELSSLEDPVAIAELLRRTALVIAPRSTIANKVGPAWPEWLSSQCPDVMPDSVAVQLTAGVYRHPAQKNDLAALRDYAALWIARHQPSESC